jgi:hypothetical protein
MKQAQGIVTGCAYLPGTSQAITTTDAGEARLAALLLCTQDIYICRASVSYTLQLKMHTYRANVLCVCMCVGCEKV